MLRFLWFLFFPFPCFLPTPWVSLQFLCHELKGVGCDRVPWHLGWLLSVLWGGAGCQDDTPGHYTARPSHANRGTGPLPGRLLRALWLPADTAFFPFSMFTQHCSSFTSHRRVCTFHCELWGEQVYYRRRGNWYSSSGPSPGGSGPGKVWLVAEGWSWHCCISAQIALAGDVENTGCGGLSPLFVSLHGQKDHAILGFSGSDDCYSLRVFGPFFHIAPFLLQEAGDMRVNHSWFHAGCWDVPMVVWGDTGQHKCPVQATSG